MEKDWKESGFSIPKVLYAVNSKSGETYLVVEDDSTIFKLMNKTGQFYMIAGFRCQVFSSPEFLNNTPFYSCENVMHPISCSKIEIPKDKFVYEKLKEYL